MKFRERQRRRVRQLQLATVVVVFMSLWLAKPFGPSVALSFFVLFSLGGIALIRRLGRCPHCGVSHLSAGNREDEREHHEDLFILRERIRWAARLTAGACLNRAPLRGRFEQELLNPFRICQLEMVSPCHSRANHQAKRGVGSSRDDRAGEPAMNPSHSEDDVLAN